MIFENKVHNNKSQTIGFAGFSYPLNRRGAGGEV